MVLPASAYLSTDKNLGIIVDRKKRTQYINMPMAHAHTAYEIYYLKNGERKYFIGDKIFNLKKGDIIFVNAGTMHRATTLNSYVHERILIQIEPEYLKDTLFENTSDLFHNYYTHIYKNNRAYFEELLSKIEREYSDLDAMSVNLMRAYTCELLTFLKRSIQHNKYVPSLSPDAADIQRCIDYMNAHLSEPLSLEKMSEISYLSNSAFSKKFKAETGINYCEYFTLLRISKAVQLLVSTDFSITRIAELCGFQSSSYFTFVFKKRKNISPLKYRMKYKIER